jgi:hypothetical protein
MCWCGITGSVGVAGEDDQVYLLTEGFFKGEPDTPHEVLEAGVQSCSGVETTIVLDTDMDIGNV